jgi:hypothetical protein
MRTSSDLNGCFVERRVFLSTWHMAMIKSYCNTDQLIFHSIAQADGFIKGVTRLRCGTEDLENCFRLDNDEDFHPE